MLRKSGRRDRIEPQSRIQSVFRVLRFASSVKSLRANDVSCYPAAAYKVGATGFEPATSWSRTKRSSQAELRPEIVAGPFAADTIR